MRKKIAAAFLMILMPMASHAIDFLEETRNLPEENRPVSVWERAKQQNTPQTGFSAPKESRIPIEEVSDSTWNTAKSKITLPPSRVNTGSSFTIVMENVGQRQAIAFRFHKRTGQSWLLEKGRYIPVKEQAPLPPSLYEIVISPSGSSWLALRYDVTTGSSWLFSRNTWIPVEENRQMSPVQQ